MAGFILGTKSVQSQLFTEAGQRVPVTHIKTSPCFLIGVKTADTAGYMSVKLGAGSKKNIRKTVAGELKKAGIEVPLHFLSEVRVERYGDDIKVIDENGKKGLQLGEVKVMVGEEIKPEAVFKKGEKVTVSGVSKGKGFQGVVKRHGFAGGPRTHGQSDRERAPGSIGQTTTPGRVYKGKRMAGRMGGDRITVKNLEVVDATADTLVVKGVVPGAQGSYVEVKSSLAF